ncbi:FAD-dependent monooxygenase [Halobacillus sp. K22]|uniref:FAD-dependent monooxygenase n=1 Tax=Halobacillus sp. K22 TaxID=3457431 RepID=UPI003FCDE97C
MQETHTDILIIGAGPSGLTLANQLERYGVRYRIIDQNKERSRFSKALVMHPRTLEMMDLLGLSQSFLQAGTPYKEIDFYYNEDMLAVLDFSNISVSADFPFVNVIPQSKTEEILESGLAQSRVERAVTLTGLEQQEELVHASIQKATSEETITARYVIGCDGAHSTTRHLLQIPFTGESEEVNVMLADVKLSPSKNGISLTSSDRGLVFVAPFQGEYTRVIVIDYKKQGEDFPEEITLADIEDSLAEIYPETLSLHEPYWISSFSASHRQASTYREGNVFLAGDAAHIHNPIGGQGMNVGIQDVMNLGWKLAYTVQHQLNETLLDSYHAERAPVAEEVIKKTSYLMKGMTIKSHYGIKARNKGMKWLLPNKKVQTKVTENMAQLDVDYSFTKFAKSFRKFTNVKKVESGNRVPDVSFLTPAKEEKTLYSMLRDHPCLYLIIAGEEHPPQYQEAVHNAVNAFNTRVGDILKPLFVTFQEVGDPRKTTDMDSELYLDLNEESNQRLHLTPGDMMVIRPDAYVLLHTSITETDQLTKALLHYFGHSL